MWGTLGVILRRGLYSNQARRRDLGAQVLTMLEYNPATSTINPTKQTTEANKIRQVGTWCLFAISSEAGNV